MDGNAFCKGLLVVWVVLTVVWCLRAFITTWLKRRAYFKEQRRLEWEMEKFTLMDPATKKALHEAEALAYYRWDEHRWKGPPRYL